jgi:hypothetical protein
MMNEISNPPPSILFKFLFDDDDNFVLQQGFQKDSSHHSLRIDLQNLSQKEKDLFLLLSPEKYEFADDGENIVTVKSNERPANLEELRIFFIDRAKDRLSFLSMRKWIHFVFMLSILVPYLLWGFPSKLEYKTAEVALLGVSGSLALTIFCIGWREEKLFEVQFQKFLEMDKANK